MRAVCSQDTDCLEGRHARVQTRLIEIACAEIKPIVTAQHKNVQDKLRAAMEALKSHWVLTTDTERIMAATASVMAYYGPGSDEYKHLKREIDLHVALSTAASGVPVDFGTLVSDDDEPMRPVGIIRIWAEVKGGE